MGTAADHAEERYGNVFRACLGSDAALDRRPTYDRADERLLAEHPLPLILKLGRKRKRSVRERSRHIG